MLVDSCSAALTEPHSSGRSVQPQGMQQKQSFLNSWLVVAPTEVGPRGAHSLKATNSTMYTLQVSGYALWTVSHLCTCMQKLVPLAKEHVSTSLVDTSISVSNDELSSSKVKLDCRWEYMSDFMFFQPTSMNSELLTYKSERDSFTSSKISASCASCNESWQHLLGLLALPEHTFFWLHELWL